MPGTQTIISPTVPAGLLADPDFIGVTYRCEIGEEPAPIDPQGGEGQEGQEGQDQGQGQGQGQAVIGC